MKRFSLLLISVFSLLCTPACTHKRQPDEWRKVYQQQYAYLSRKLQREVETGKLLFNYLPEHRSHYNAVHAYLRYNDSLLAALPEPAFATLKQREQAYSEISDEMLALAGNFMNETAFRIHPFPVYDPDEPPELYALYLQQSNLRMLANMANLTDYLHYRWPYALPWMYHDALPVLVSTETENGQQYFSFAYGALAFPERIRYFEKAQLQDAQGNLLQAVEIRANTQRFYVFTAEQSTQYPVLKTSSCYRDIWDKGTTCIDEEYR